MTTPKRRILSFVFTVLCFKKSFLLKRDFLLICIVLNYLRKTLFEKARYCVVFTKIGNKGSLVSAFLNSD